ncbi:hypothetical protein QE152_g7502 [Popillia japonica]|uniref:Uncharacterized protein n=1 Tax=Popillia japonica TaxID=7064 RepID=A0AAW1MEH9_POPJA
MLIAYVSDNRRNWNVMLPKVTCAIRIAKHDVIGHTPYFINFGREMHVTGERRFTKPIADDTPIVEEHDPEQLIERSANFSQLYRDIKARLQKAYERAKSRYDTRHRREDFLPNQLVWRKNFAFSHAAQYYTAKLADKFIGPFMIHQRTSTDTYELKTWDGKILPGSWHASLLKHQPSAD